MSMESGGPIQGGGLRAESGEPASSSVVALTATDSPPSGPPPSALSPQPSTLRPPRFPSPQPPAPGPVLAYAAWLWYLTLYGPCFAISKAMFRYRCAGKPHVPITGPVLIVSNHQSNLDPVLIGLGCPRQLKYFARIGLFFWPFSWWIRALGAVPIDQKSAINGIKTTLKLLKQGEAIVVFPEGSRTPDGKLHEMLPGFCVLARRSGATIVPTAIDGAFDALPRGAALPRLAEITLTICEPIMPREVAAMSDEQLTRLVVERISAALQGGIFGEQLHRSP